jgi:flagellar biosynthesis protein FlhG
LPDLADLPQAQLEILLRALLVLDGTIDLLLIDTSAGVGREVVQFILAAGEMLLVTNPEPTAIADAYALMKVVSGYQLPVSTKLVVNNVREQHEGEVTGHRLAAVAEQFLGRRIEMMGIVPHDKSVIEAVKMQLPLLQSHPYSPVATAINRLGERLWSGQPREDTLTGVARFFKRLLSFKPSSNAVVSELNYAHY